MKALFLFCVITLIKQIIDWEEQNYYLKISSIPVDRNIERKKILYAIKNVKKNEAVYTKRKRAS